LRFEYNYSRPNYEDHALFVQQADLFYETDKDQKALGFSSKMRPLHDNIISPRIV